MKSALSGAKDRGNLIEDVAPANVAAEQLRIYPFEI